MQVKVEVLRETCKETFAICLEELTEDGWHIKHYAILMVDGVIEYFAILERKGFAK